jgi:hypothetical protein
VSTETNPSQYIPGRGLELTMEWSADALGGARTASDDGEAESLDAGGDHAADDRSEEGGTPSREESGADFESGTGDGDREGVETDGGTGGT